MRTYVDGHKTYLTRMTTVCKTCESYAFILVRREILSTQNSPYENVSKRMPAYLDRMQNLYINYNDLDVFEKFAIRRVIRRKIRSCYRPIKIMWIQFGLDWLYTCVCIGSYALRHLSIRDKKSVKTLCSA